MKQRLLQVLGCPRCGGELALDEAIATDDREIITGALCCAGCDLEYPITRGIPRFVGGDGYAASFGLQWNLFHAEQLDSINGLHLSSRRFWHETGWPQSWLAGRWILDAGCGAGRFLDVLSNYGCDVVGVDLSNSVDAAYSNLRQHPNVHLVQASIYELPFRRDAFDGCYSIGVVQHTPDPTRTLTSLAGGVKSGGRVATTIYERNRWTHLNAKYLSRRVTTRMSDRHLLLMIKMAMPVLFPLTELLFRLPVIGRVFQFLIPVANYGGRGFDLTLRSRYRWAVMDTFDMLAPRYDNPQTESDAVQALESGGVTSVTRTSMGGLSLAGFVQEGG